MSWTVEWGGRATDFVPDLLRTTGKPGATAYIAVESLYGAVQSVGERDSQAWVKAVARGNESPEEGGVGSFTVEVSVIGDEPSVEDQLESEHKITGPERNQG